MDQTHIAYFERTAGLRTLRDLWVYNIAYNEDMARAYDFVSEQVAQDLINQTHDLAMSPLSAYILATRRPIRYYCFARQEELRRSGLTGSTAIECLKSELEEHANTWILEGPEAFSWSGSESENEGSSREDLRDDKAFESNSGSLSDSSAGSSVSQHNDESPSDPLSVIQRLQQVPWSEILSLIYNFIHRLLTDILTILRFIFQTPLWRWIFSAALYYAILGSIIYLFMLWLWGSTQSTVSSICGLIFRPVTIVGTLVSDNAKTMWSALSGTLSPAGKYLNNMVLDKASNFTLVLGSMSSFMTTLATNPKYIFSSSNTTTGGTHITLNATLNTAVTDIGEAMKDFFKICALSGISIHPISASISVGLSQVYAAGNVARASQVPLRQELGEAYDSLAIHLDQLFFRIQDFNIEVKATTRLSRFELSSALNQISQIKIESTQFSDKVPSTAWSMPFWYGCFHPSPWLPHQQTRHEHAANFIFQVVSCNAASLMDTFLLNDPNDELAIRSQGHNSKAINSTIHEFTHLTDTMSRDFSRLQILVDQALQSSQGVRSSFNLANEIFKRSELQIRDRKAEVQHYSSKRAEWGTWKKLRSSRSKRELDLDDEKELLALASKVQSLGEIASLEGKASRSLETVKTYLQNGRAKIKQVSVTVREMGMRYESGMIHERRMRALTTTRDAASFAELTRQFIEILSPYVADLEGITRELDWRSLGVEGVVNEAWEECRALIAKRKKLEAERNIGGFGIRDEDLGDDKEGEGSGVRRGVRQGEDVETCVLRVLWSRDQLEEGKGKGMGMGIEKGRDSPARHYLF